MARGFGWSQQTLDYQSLHCLYRILPRNIRSSLQEAACDWTASWLSAKTDYPLCIIRRCRLTQWSRHQGCMQGERKMATYHYGNQLLISDCSLGAAASLDKQRLQQANHHNISSLGIQPLRRYKFYFQIHSDLYPKVGVVLEVLATGNN